MSSICGDCRALVARGRVRCVACEAKRTAERNARRGGSGWANQANNARVKARDGGCVMAGHGECGGPLRVDHVQPLAAGGADDDGNKRTLCLAHHQGVTPRGGG